MQIDEHQIKTFLSSLQANGHSAHTLRAYKSDLEGFLKNVTGGISNTLNQTEDEYAKLAGEYLNSLSDAAPTTVRRKLAALRRFHHWQSGGWILSGYRAPVPAKPEPHPLSGGIPDVIAMCGAANKQAHRAAVALCGLAGLRIGEALQVEPHDFNFVGSAQIIVRGKGKKQRRVPLSTECGTQVAQAITVAQNLNTTLCGGMSDGPARAAIRRIGKRALGIEVSSHDLRATFATAAYNKTKDIRVVQELLGHANIHTTEVYTGVTKKSMANAADLS